MLFLILRHWNRSAIFQKLQEKWKLDFSGQKGRLNIKRKNHGGREEHGKINEDGRVQVD